MSLSSKIIALLPLLTSAAALASGGGESAGGHHGGPHVQNWWGLVGHAEAPAIGWLSITFLIFVAGIVFLARKPINMYLANRSDAVKTALEEAKEAKAKAEAAAALYAERVANLDKEIDELKRDFRTRGEAEMQRMEENGKKSGERMLKDAKDTIAAESDRAQDELKAEASRLAIELAEGRIQSRLQSSDHARLSSSFLSDIQSGPSGAI